MGRRRVVNVHMLSFAHIMNHEATKSLSMTACAGARECKLPSAPGEVSVKVLSDRGSTPLISTIRTAFSEHCKMSAGGLFMFPYFAADLRL